MEPRLRTKRGLPLVSPEEIKARSTANSGFSRALLAEWGVSWPPPKGWRRRLEHRWLRAQYPQQRPRRPAPRRSPAPDAPWDEVNPWRGKP